MSHSVLQEIIVLLAVSVISVVVFRRLAMPPILAYLFVGMLVGPYGWEWINDSEDIRFLAEFGVVFLMFTVGLEFSLPQLIAMRKAVFGIGGAQVVMTTTVVVILLLLTGQSFSTAFIIGGVIALSSTAIVIKQLNEQLEIQSRHGRLSVAILIFQDLAVIPFLIIIPTLASDAQSGVAMDLLFALFKAILVIGIMLAAGRWLLRPLFQEVAKQHSAELFTLAILLFSVTAAWITDLAGLSLALGAFIAGMMLAETEFKHQVEVDIRPFRDVLLGLFFITVGMLLNLQVLPSLFPWIMLTVLCLIVIKFVVIMTIAHFTHIEKGVASRTGLVLAQGGEFGFAILSIAFANGVMNQELSQIILASLIISMVISPFIIRYNGHLTKRWFADSYLVMRDRNLHEIEEETLELEGHVAICGYGRIGQNIARFISKEGFDYVAVDLDPVTVREAHDAGEHVFYGNSTNKEILKAMNLKSARILVISYDDYNAAKVIIENAHTLNPDIPILVRTRDDSHLTELQELGATEVVPETLEASLMLSSHLMILLGIPVRRVFRSIQEVRQSRYQLLHEFYHGQDVADTRAADIIREGLHSFTVPDGAFCVGKTLDELQLDKFNVKVTTLRHDGITHQKPAADVLLEAGDVLVLYSTPEDSERAQMLLLRG